MDEIWGATIERGIITKKNGKAYTVKSFSRDGVVSAEDQIASIWDDRRATVVVDGVTHEISFEEYKVGDKVYYCQFDDGKGVIFGKMQA